ncbi:D-tyrosyl-tRNA(Tyr) deacylase [Marinilactibacillus piezotolerans]|uniref:D-aminoacyl-tRNA deacylase n=1 Tax=Marinilactibacillus piezotolerans TaxID=258723 RepID=A0A1I3UTJ2_9LACT|nr:D-aminoacyl-tRNA deacylase [Marinilactibacillus piezotolerans]SFJ85406.1 D-tyrosyl-tRNA(Tyr) deacylase [Marinilactibacillus piezotolerans]
MRLVIQRVTEAQVKVNGEIKGSIETGMVVLVGICHSDTEEDINYLVRKVKNMRIFEDNEGKMNLSLAQVGGSILSISQFTLYADTKKGNRPSFVDAARPDQAIPLYEKFNYALSSEGINVQTGRFGEDMKVSLLNDGPVTIVIDSKNK